MAPIERRDRDRTEARDRFGPASAGEFETGDRRTERLFVRAAVRCCHGDAFAQMGSRDTIRSSIVPIDGSGRRNEMDLEEERTWLWQEKSDW
jgi:hypothetical protein